MCQTINETHKVKEKSTTPEINSPFTVLFTEPVMNSTHAGRTQGKQSLSLHSMHKFKMYSFGEKNYLQYQEFVKG